MIGESTAMIRYLVNPWLPRGQVVGFFGRGETAKSSFVATLASEISTDYTTLWISTEEPVDWIKTRHIQIGGTPGTLLVFKAVVTKTDATGRAAASTFNVYEHLEASIQQAIRHVPVIAEGTGYGEHPLRLVVLDTAVALTTWGKSESPNDDASVKRLMAYLLSICEKYDITIAIIGHSNKGKHDNLTDTVAGSSAWVNSPRQAFTHIRDQQADYAFVACTVKSTLTGTFAAPYRTIPVHVLFRRADGKDSVLCKVQMGDIEWGFNDAMALVDAALGRDEDGQENQTDRKVESINRIVTTVIELLRVPGVLSTDRANVKMSLGYEPNRRHWQEADHALMTQHAVDVKTLARGRFMYEWRK